MNKTRKSRRHALKIERAVNDLSPLVWVSLSRALNKWLKITLVALEPQFKNLVIETRAVDPFDLRAVADMIANVSSLAEPPDFDEIIGLIADNLVAQLFIPRDPRADSMRQYLQEVSIQRVTSIWTNLTTPDRLARHLLEFKKDGGTYLEISRKVQTAYSKQLYVAERLVRTTSNAGFNYGDYVSKLEDGVERHSWLSSQDKRVRRPPKSAANHKALDGQTVKVGEPFTTERGFRLLFPGDASLGAPADEVINCFTPETMLEGVDLTKAYKRWYSGEIVTIRLESGNEFSCTPNHPILTRGGFVRASELNKIGHVFKSSFAQRATIGAFNVYYKPTQAQELFNSLHEVGMLVRGSGRVVNFHGDGRDGNVDIVTLGGELEDSVEPLSKQILEHFPFTLPDILQGLLSRLGTLRQSRQSVFATPESSICGGGLLSPLLWRFINPLEALGIAGATNINPAPNEARFNKRAANAKLFSQFNLKRALFVSGANFGSNIGMFSGEFGLNNLAFAQDGNAPSYEAAFDNHVVSIESLSDFIQTFAAPVTLDHVVNISSAKYDGHVYNLETSTGVYLSNGVISHNCRCTTLDEF